MVLQEQKSWEQLIDSNTVTGNASELFFEENDLDAFLNSLEEYKDIRVGDVRVNSWGKRVVMLKDPDDHLIEVAEGANGPVDHCSAPTGVERRNKF